MAQYLRIRCIAKTDRTSAYEGIHAQEQLTALCGSELILDLTRRVLMW
jgi:hypothetical protein